MSTFLAAGSQGFLCGRFEVRRACVSANFLLLRLGFSLLSLLLIFACSTKVTAQTLSSLALSPTSITGSASSTGTVTLSANAPSGGAVVNLSSNNVVASVPSSVTVSAGSKTKTFTITTIPVASNQAVTITASKSGSSNKTKTLTVKAPVPTSLSLSPTTVQGGNGNTSTGTVTLNTAAPVGGIIVNLSANNSAASPPSTVTVAGGTASKTFAITALPTAVQVTAQISAAYNGTTKNSNLKILKIPVPSIEILAGNGRLGVEFFHDSIIDAYIIKRSSTDGGPYANVGTLTSDQIVGDYGQFIDAGLTNGTTYYYVVCSVIDGVEGANSNQVSDTPSMMTPPSSLSVTSMRGALKLNWTNSPHDYSKICARRGTQPGGPYPTILDVWWGSSSLVDASAEAGVTYYYVIELTAGVETLISNEDSGSATSSAPTLSITNTFQGKLYLTWSNSDPFPYCYYTVKRAEDPGGPYTKLADVPVQPYGGSSYLSNSFGGFYVDETTLVGSTYYYVVEGEYFPEVPPFPKIPIARSNEVSGTHVNITPPGLPTFSNISWDRVTITAPVLPVWADSLSLQKKLQSEPETSYVTAANNLSGSTETIVTGLSAVTEYSFRYVANSSYTSENGAGANVKTKVGTPDAPSIENVTGTSIELKMPILPPGATSLILEKLTDTTTSSVLPPTSNMIGWYKADALTSLNNSLVSYWPDASPSGNHASQTSGVRQPLLVHGVANGKSAIRFSGGEDVFGNGDFLSMPEGKRDFTAGYSAFAIVKPDSSGGIMTIVDLSNGFNPYSYVRFSRNGVFFGAIPNNGSSYYGIGNGDIWGAGSLEGGGLQTSKFQMLGVVQQGGEILVPSNVNLYRNGATVASGQLPVPEIVDRKTNFIGAAGDNQGHVPFMGDIAEIILYDSALSESQRHQVEEYLSRKYFIGANNAPVGTWTTIATGLAGESTYNDTVLAAETTYWYRCRAVNGAETSDPGPVAMATTLSAAPDAPAAPTFGISGAYTIPVIAPALPARAAHLRLQRKQADGTFIDIADNVAPGSTTLARELRPGQTYVFRFVAVGRGGETNGIEAGSTTASTDVSGSGTGLRGFYYAFGPGNEFKDLLLTRLDPTVDFQWGQGSPDPSIGNSFCVRWIGQVEPTVSGLHTIYFKHGNWDNIKVWVNGQLLIEYQDGLPGERSGDIDLTAGKKYDIVIEYLDHAGDGAPDEGYAELRWSCTAGSLAKQIIPQLQLYPVLLPEAPGAPVIEQVASTSVLIAQPAWPANTRRLNLQMKETRYADDAYTNVATDLPPGEKTLASSLKPITQYSFRYVAIGYGTGITANGAVVNVWTHPSWPSSPFPPTFLNRSATTVTIQAPALPENAQSMTLQQSVGDASNYVDIAQGLPAEVVTEATGLTLGVTYYFRYVAVNAYGSAPGEGKPITTVASPDAPAAPVFVAIGTDSAEVNVTAVPANASQVRLERKVNGEPDSAYAIIFELNPSATGTRQVMGLASATTYVFRYVAVRNESDGNVAPTTPSPTTTITTLTNAPEPPGAPQFSNITKISLTATTPELPERAVTLVLQKKLSADPDTSYADVAIDLQGEQDVEVTGLTAGTDYHFRCIAVNAEGATVGVAASVTTGDGPPGIPGAPAFSALTYDSVLTANVIVTPSSFPALTTWMNLEMKEAGEPDTEYQVVDDQIELNQTSSILGLYNGKTYTFRYVALGIGGSTPGLSADLTVGALTSAWQVDTPIFCEGIVTPQGNVTVDVEAELPLSSGPASDWDLRVWKLGGVVVGSKRLSDPCTYQWSATGGSFKAARSKGQSVTWIAPVAPGTYTITLTVNDQNTLNVGTGETGSRNDDPALVFTKTVTVQ